MKKNNFQLLNDYLLDLQSVDSLEKMDSLIEDLSSAADQVYPCISCKTGCFTCCTGPSMPPVYPKEWQRIREYLKGIPGEELDLIKDKALGMIQRHEETLNFVYGILKQIATLDDLKKYTKRLIHDLKEESCPFHINGKCMVYQVRPTKCRAFGYFSFVFDGNVQMLSCVSDLTKMHEYLKEKRTKQIVLPYWNYFERKLMTLVQDESETFDMNIIPLWLKSDIEQGKL